MKKIFFIAAIAAFSFASAQNNRDTFWINPIPPKPKVNSYELPKTYRYNFTARVLDQAKWLNTLPNRNKVYALPMDNMPCIVPDMTQYNMPVVKPDIVYTIPNPAYPSTKFAPAELEKLRQQLQEHFDKGSTNRYYFNFK